MLDEGFIYGLRTCTRLDHIEHQVLALDELVPDLLRMVRGFTDSCGAADAGVIAIDDREYLHPTDVARLEPAVTGSHVRKDAPLAGGHDHEFECVGTPLENAAGERAGDVHLRLPG